MIITSAARHRPVQVHDDAGRAASFSGRARRVPLQVPQPGHRPRAVHRRDPRAGRTGCARCASASSELDVPARHAVHQERLRRLPRSVPAQHQVRSRSRRRRRATAEIDIAIKGPWLHTILFEIPVLAIVNEVYFRATQPVPDFVEGRRRLRDKIALIAQQPGRWTACGSPTTARAGASRAPGTTK